MQKGFRSGISSGLYDVDQSVRVYECRLPSCVYRYRVGALYGCVRILGGGLWAVEEAYHRIQPHNEIGRHVETVRSMITGRLLYISSD